MSRRPPSHNKTRRTTAGNPSRVMSLDSAQSAFIFQSMANALNLIGTRASAIALNGPLNLAQKTSLVVALEMVDIMKSECVQQVLKITRAARAESEN